MANEPATQVKKGEIVTPTPYSRFLTYAKDRAELDGSFAFKELHEEQMNSILTAENEDSLFEAMEMAGLMGLNELDDGTEIQINEYHLVTSTRSEFASDTGVFAVIDAQLLSDGTPMALDTSVTRVLGFLRMVESGAAGIKFPVQVRIKKITTGNGQLVTFAKIPVRAVKTG